MIHKTRHIPAHPGKIQSALEGRDLRLSAILPGCRDAGMCTYAHAHEKTPKPPTRCSHRG